MKEVNEGEHNRVIIKDEWLNTRKGEIWTKDNKIGDNVNQDGGKERN